MKPRACVKCPPGNNIIARRRTACALRHLLPGVTLYCEPIQSGSLPLFAQQVFEKIEDGVVLEIPKLTGVEERTAADGTMLKPDVRLVDVHHADHLAAASGAVDAIYFVESTAHLRVANVDCLGLLHLLQVFLFECVEEEALAACATVHLHVREGD